MSTSRFTVQTDSVTFFQHNFADSAHETLPGRDLVLQAATTEIADLTQGAGVGIPDPTCRALGLTGLTQNQVNQRREYFGDNSIALSGSASAISVLARAIVNPFVLILLFLAAVMYGTDVVLASPDEGDITGTAVIGTMVAVSVLLRFWQEYRSSRAAEALQEMIETTCAVTRLYSGTVVTSEIPTDELVRGDVVHLSAGDMVPADMRIISSKDLQVNESSLTGESVPAEKTAYTIQARPDLHPTDCQNLVFFGTTVVSGTAVGLVVATGQDTCFSDTASAALVDRPPTTFDQGIKNVSYLLIRYMSVMVFAVFILNGMTKNWNDALLFAVSVAVGLTPEMLPLIVTATMARGAAVMGRHKVIVTRLNAIQDFGAMDVLCTDKTGTLTEDQIILRDHRDVTGSKSDRVLTMAAANSHFQTGVANPIDLAVLRHAGQDKLSVLDNQFQLVDELPFDFDRRMLSVVLKTNNAQEANGTQDNENHFMIVKGAAQEVLRACRWIEQDDTVRELSSADQVAAQNLLTTHGNAGLRVLAVATRVFPVPKRSIEQNAGTYCAADETNLTLVGFLTFLDPPKKSATTAVTALKSHGTAVKVVTGDDPSVAAMVCRQVGIDPAHAFTGSDVDAMSPDQLRTAVSHTHLFAKMTPVQKAQVVEALRDIGHTVGFLGDGVNDAPALRTADVGISVDTAVDIAKECADVILLEKDLMVLEAGVQEGRRTFANAMKYVKITASSNFGNVFSVLVASAWLPFLPMLPVVLLLQNLAYDLSMLTMTVDKVDADVLARPHRWDAQLLGRFMMRLGPISSVFDIITFTVMWFVFGAMHVADASLFQSGWFIESIISQTMIVHVFRTGRVPFRQSTAAWPVLLATGAVGLFGLALPFSSFGHSLGLCSLPWTYFPWLIGILAAYYFMAQTAKRVFITRFHEWL